MLRLASGRGWLVAGLLASSSLLAAPLTFAQDGEEHAQPVEQLEPVPGASALEGRIMAPCCWQQTIDIHGSEISNQLRHEIRRRLKAGESSETIEADLVARYGRRILAVPPGNPLKDVGVLLSLAFGLGGIGAGALLLRWRRRSQAARAEELDREDERPKKKGGKKRDQWDEEIDAELEKL